MHRLISFLFCFFFLYNNQFFHIYIYIFFVCVVFDICIEFILQSKISPLLSLEVLVVQLVGLCVNDGKVIVAHSYHST